jgi:peptidoglycan hydrolase CwlO-like protein
MKKLKFLILLVFAFLFFYAGKEFMLLAEACSDKSDINAKIECYESELGKLTSQSKTLSSQISQFNAQIKLTTLKITQTEEKIALLGGRIDQLEGSLDTLTTAFSSRAVETYKMARLGDPLMIVVSAPDLTEAVSRFYYLKRIQESDRDLMQRLQTAQTTYENQKTEEEVLQKQLEKQKSDLNAQKKAKDALLAQTKNDEVKYQQLLAQAYAEKAAIEKALVSGTKVGPIKKGDPIALVGNSGWHSDPYKSCSTAKHLHFEIRKGGTWVDPTPFLQNKSVENKQDYNGGMVSIGSGSWPWPVEDPIWLTQFYGKTPYSWRYPYSGFIHTGLDLVPKTSDVIRAPADGTLYKSSQLCVAGGNIINIVYIEHADGVISLYLHVQ